ncbi:hypothetical protein ACR78Z_05025 [Sphingobacterium thalpophilum]|uniref:hypothetical protein n=1 Tax=Sphingobacterium thalpophilum TaxID=259 RepID=UPI003D952F4A
MKMIKKGTIWLLGIVMLFVITGWGIYVIRQQQSYKSLVHKKSKALLTISLDDILLSQLFDRWQTAPKAGQDYAKKLRELKNNGIDIKANVFLFSLEDTARNFYAFFDLNDKKQFLSFLKDGLAIDSIQQDIAPGISYAYQERHKIAFMWRGKELLVGLGFDLDQKRTEMLQLIQSKDEQISIENFISRPSTLTRKSMRYSDMSTQNFIEFDLKGGRMEIFGEFTSKHWNFPKTYTVRKLAAKDYIGRGWINFPDGRLKRRIKHILRDLPISADSIMAHTTGEYMDMEILNSRVVQVDTIVSYAVDDNFETVEEKTRYEHQVPDLRFGFRGDKELHKYLPAKLFYQWFQKQEGSFNILSTASTAEGLQTGYGESDELLHADIQLEDWPDALKVPSVLSLKAVAANINVSLKVTGPERLVLQASIQDYSN